MTFDHRTRKPFGLICGHHNIRQYHGFQHQGSRRPCRYEIMLGRRNLVRGDMIEVFKITHDLYDPDVSLNLAYPIFLLVLLIFGTVYLTMLSMLILSTYLKHV